MVQLSTIFNAISKSRKSNEPAVDFAKGDRDLALTSYAQRSENFAAAHSKRGKKGINQDRFVVSELEGNMVFCGVFDGHGPWGHHAAKTVRRLMPPVLLRTWREVAATNPDSDDEKHDMQFDIWRRSYYMACAAIDQELERQTKIDSFYSGSTALTLVREGDLVIIANVGDSRAVLASVSDEGELVATQLTTDLKPNLPSECDRIAQSRGRVYSCPDEPGVHRVWQPKLSGPGLAVSRAFGDYFIKDFGLISEPEVTKRWISSKDEFVILATDGVWDVVSNQEAVEIVFSAPERALSAKRLVEHAVRAWKRRGGANVMDDVSVVCLFFHRLDEL